MALCVCVLCLIISVASRLSLSSFLSRKREKNKNEDFLEGEGQKQNLRHTRWWRSALDERGIKLIFPGTEYPIWGSEKGRPTSSFCEYGAIWIPPVFFIFRVCVEFVCFVVVRGRWEEHESERATPFFEEDECWFYSHDE